LASEECDANPNCSTIGGMMMEATEDDDFCIDWEAEGAIVGCKDTGPCDDAETYARPEDKRNAGSLLTPVFQMDGSPVALERNVNREPTLRLLPSSSVVG
jgi:hypothetical protein